MRRSLLVLSSCVAAALTIPIVGSNPVSAATPVRLVIAQPTAFAMLGASCGGIQEKVYATGFDATTGYPTGYVYLSTRCGGSGRGGGGHTHLYSAWALASWGLDAGLASTTRTATPPSVDPNLVAYDIHGNEVYNQTTQAYLQLAPGFLLPPRLTSLSPNTGPSGTSIAINGTAFSGATTVTFGGTTASFSVVSNSSIMAAAPSGIAGTVDIVVTTPAGQSAMTVSDRFTYTTLPGVTGLNPNQGSADGGDVVIVTGANFNGATAVAFGGIDAQFSVVNATTIRVITPPGPDSNIAVDVIVITPSGWSRAVAADRFTFI